MEPFILMLIFSIALFLAAASLCFTRDPKNSPLLFRVYNLRKMSKAEAAKKAREVGTGVALVAAVILIGSIIGMLADSIGWFVMAAGLAALLIWQIYEGRK
ncbi:MAG: hypothetical protein IJT77_12620 [Clostridia bacterium]|nr:hypothetical protein [Clostridia bacterium]